MMRMPIRMDAPNSAEAPAAVQRSGLAAGAGANAAAICRATTAPVRPSRSAMDRFASSNHQTASGSASAAAAAAAARR